MGHNLQFLHRKVTSVSNLWIVKCNWRYILYFWKSKDISALLLGIDFIWPKSIFLAPEHFIYGVPGQKCNSVVFVQDNQTSWPYLTVILTTTDDIQYNQCWWEKLYHKHKKRKPPVEECSFLALSGTLEFTM